MVVHGNGFRQLNGRVGRASERGMCLHRLELVLSQRAGLQEDAVLYPHLADVMERACKGYPLYENMKAIFPAS